MLSEFVAVSLFLLTYKYVNTSVPTLPASLNLYENVCMPSEKRCCLQSEGRISQVNSGAFIQPHCEHVLQCNLYFPSL